MKINEYIKAFYEKNDDIRPLPWIMCRDGFRMSVQVGHGINSIPKHIISAEEWKKRKKIYMCRMRSAKCRRRSSKTICRRSGKFIGNNICIRTSKSG